MPDGYTYTDVQSTLAINEVVMQRNKVRKYNLRSYQEHVRRQNTSGREKAVMLLKEGAEAAKSGGQRAARNALESAWHYYQSDAALNEDARVQLNQLVQQQAMIGLLGSRGRLREQIGTEPSGQSAGRQMIVDENIWQDDTERMANALNKYDSAHLQRITNKIVWLQQAAAATPTQLVVNMPLRGLVVGLVRPIQVNPHAEMVVAYSAAPIIPAQSTQRFYWLGAMFGELLVGCVAAPKMGLTW